MKDPYDEEIANRIGPESCAVVRKGDCEAFTGGMQAGLLSREKPLIQGADAIRQCGRQHGLPRKRELRQTARKHRII